MGVFLIQRGDAEMPIASLQLWTPLMTKVHMWWLWFTSLLPETHAFGISVGPLSNCQKQPMWLCLTSWTVLSFGLKFLTGSLALHSHSHHTSVAWCSSLPFSWPILANLFGFLNWIKKSSLSLNGADATKLICNSECVCQNYKMDYKNKSNKNLTKKY